MKNTRNKKLCLGRSLEDLCGVPLAIKILRNLYTEYPLGIPFKKAESYFENTYGVLSYGRSTNDMFQKLENYGFININNGTVSLKNLDAK